MRSKFKWIFTLLVAFTMQFSFAQQKTVTGTVISDGVALPGASIMIKGTNQGTTSNDAGKYSIKAKEGDVLVVTFLNKKDQSATVGSSNVINFTLASTDQVIDVVVVEGALGLKRTKDEVTAAQKQIGSKELNQASNPNAVQALVGKVSGLQINTTSNSVNSSTRIVLRGNRSVTGNNQALVVIDNVISSADVLQQLPPQVIDNVNVIKGAQGAALYGAQGVNGVIIVTTKKGSKQGKLSVSVNSSVDFQDVMFVPEVQTEYGQGWITDVNFDGSASGIPAGNGFVPFENGSWGPAYSDSTMPSMVPVGLPQADGTFVMTPWKARKNNTKDFFKTGVITQNGITLNSGGADSYVMFSANRLTNDFVVDGDKLKRNSFIFKAGKTLDKFTVGGTVTYISQSSTQTDSDLMDDLLQTPTDIPITTFGALGGLNEHHWTPFATSPYWRIKNVRQNSKNNYFNGVLNLSYDLTKNISFSYNGNIQLNAGENQSYQDNWHAYDYVYNFGAYTYTGSNSLAYSDLGNDLTSSYYANQTMYRNYYGDLMVNFKYDLTNDLKLKFNVGNNLQDYYNRTTTQGGKNLDRDGYFHIINVLNPAKPKDLSNGSYNTRVAAFFGNLDLNYKDYLFLNGTIRWEETSRVKKHYLYPSVGLSFVPTKAFESIKGNVLNYMKLNASYTSVGNTSAIGAYDITNLATVHSGFNFGNLMSYGYNQNQYDPNIKPEFVNTFEFGGQFGFFNDRITLEASYFDSKTVDLITNTTTSAAPGSTRYLTNIGDLTNKGFEIDLGLVPVKTQNFRWDVRANYSTYKTKVTSLKSGMPNVSLVTYGQVGIFAEEGEDFPLIKGTKFIRDANGNIVVDGNGTPMKTSTMEKLGKATPDYIIGLTNSFDYKGLKFVVVADYRYGASTWTEAKQLLTFTGGDLDTAGFDRTQGYVVPNSVTTSGQANTTPVNNDASYAGVVNYFTTNHRFVGESNVIDATALKIREMSLSYTLPKKMLKGTGIEAFTFGVNARNPFVFVADGKFIKPKHGLANNKYGDPEANYTTGNAQGLMNIGQYPTTRTYGFTVNLTF
ncbi:SusC/RagA family TonB-linked outer membrane protein [Flavobacterium sp.]|uniref:SusC/RagA family TonB-linked outer membrane protein n=1 Tax=Flavobacterium sp. TaxID=239 RepID=UPI0035B28BF7